MLVHLSVQHGVDHWHLYMSICFICRLASRFLEIPLPRLRGRGLYWLAIAATIAIMVLIKDSRCKNRIKKHS